jgi:hypothetical protein
VTALERVAAVARRLPGRRPRALVLVYHRVGERGLDSWHLTIDPETFAGQMKTLAPRRRRELADPAACRQRAAVGRERSSPWEATPGTRLRAFYDIWLALRGLDAATRDAALDEIAECAGAPRPSGRALLTREQLRELAALPGFGLGAHTLTHPALPGCPPEDALPRSPAAPSGFAHGSASMGSSSPTPSARGTGASRVWSPSSASAPPTRPTGMRSRGARRRTRFREYRPTVTLRATSRGCWPTPRAGDHARPVRRSRLRPDSSYVTEGRTPAEV